MRIWGFILFLTLFIGCKQEKTTVSNFDSYPDTPTISKNSFYRQKIDLLTSIYNLQAITKGTKDSLTIRFWPREAFEPFENMCEIRLDSIGWKGYQYCAYSFPDQDGIINHPYGYENLGDSVFIVKQIVPKCGWNKFSDSLIYFQINDLPTEKLINGFKEQVARDGTNIQFEIATKKNYRWIQYSNPKSYNYRECKTIVELTEMIARQLGDGYSWPKKTIK